jgi:hypothetical protein
MNQAIERAFRIATFDRKAARQVSFDSSATGDAVLLVAAIEAVVALAFVLAGGGFDLRIFVESVILGVASWLILAAAIWLMGTRVLKGSAAIESMFRVSGFARLPLLLGAVDGFVGNRLFGQIGLVWYLALLVVATGVALGLGWKESLGAVVLGTAVVLLIQLIFRASFFRI